jgi:cell division protease FtsH
MVLFSGADLENTLNEAAIIAAKKGSKQVSGKDIENAALKVRYGPQRKSRKREKEDLKMVAYHEAGHAIVAHYTEGADPVRGVSIISRGMTGGMTMLVPEKDRENHTQKQMLARIVVATGGNVAESIVFGDVSTGASSDIKNATDIARDMVTKYGMSKKLGFVKYGTQEDTLALGYGYETKEYSDDTAREIDEAIKSIVQKAWNEAENILREHKDQLDKMAGILLDKEEIDEQEFRDFFKKSSKK